MFLKASSDWLAKAKFARTPARPPLRPGAAVAALGEALAEAIRSPEGGAGLASSLPSPWPALRGAEPPPASTVYGRGLLYRTPPTRFDRGRFKGGLR